MDKSRVEPTIFFIEKISFSLKLFPGHFYGQSFIKTVRGPCWKSHATAQFYPAFLLLLGSKKGRDVGQQTDEIVAARALNCSTATAGPT